MMNLKAVTRKTSRFIFIILASLWIMFEEWVWDTIMAVMVKIGRLKIINLLENYLARQNPYLLLSLFLFPFLIMIPAKVYGVYLVAEGKILRGILIFVLAKSIITAFIARLFFVSRDKLMQIKNFAVSYYWLKEKKDWLYGELNKLPAWQTARKSVAELKRFIKNKVRTRKQSSGFVTKIRKEK